MDFRRLAGIAGLAAVVMIVVSIATSGSPPALDASADDVVSYYQDNEGALRVASMASQLGGLLFAVFAAGLLAAMWAAGRPGGRGSNEQLAGRGWAFLALVGLAAMYSSFDTTAASNEALLFNTDGLGDDLATRALYDFSGIHFALASFNGGVFMLGVGAAVLTTGLLPRWLGWLALAGAALGILTAFAHGDEGALAGPLGLTVYLAQLVMLVFTVGTSIVLLRTRAAETAAS